MDKIVVVVILVVLAIVLSAAISRKSVAKFIKDLNVKKHIPIAKISDGFHTGTKKRSGTILVPDLELYQLNADGTIFHKHSIAKRDVYDEKGTMIGLAISHPGADCDGIVLYGKKKKDGTFDDKDPGTYAALTVNTGALRIGHDSRGFYGEVTNSNARVYIATEDKKTKALLYGEQFDIVDSTYILVGNQWLYFSTPSLPAFPGAKIAGRHSDSEVVADTSLRVPTIDHKKTEGMKRREKVEKRTDLNAFDKVNHNSGMSIRFPTDE